jgi:hypothetical protein
MWLPIAYLHCRKCDELFAVRTKRRCLALIFALLLCGCGPSEESISFTWEAEFWSAYGSNELDADQQYKGKLIEFTARGKVEKDANGIYFVGCPCASPVPPNAHPAIVCYFDPPEVDKIAFLKEGRALRVVGRCQGKTKDSRALKGYRVTLTSCRVLKRLTWKNGAYRE